MSGDIAVANAPVSYGAFELTVGTDPDVLRRQAESFAEVATGAACEGATAEDAVAALTAAEQVTAAMGLS